MTDRVPLEESFEYSLRNFLEWLEIMAMEPTQLCNTWGNYNVAWELVTDLNVDGEEIVSMPCSYLSKEQKTAVIDFINNLKHIPEEVLTSATSAEENQKAMHNPCWLPHKKAAAILIQKLESAATKNRDYFSNL